MYWKLFEALYAAHAKRKSVIRLNAIRDAMVAGIWSNSNYDAQEQGKEGPRREILEKVEMQFSEAIASVYAGDKPAPKKDIDWDDPFFSAMSSPRINTEAAIHAEDDSMPPEELSEAQAERKRMIGDLDQS